MVIAERRPTKVFQRVRHAARHMRNVSDVSPDHFAGLGLPAFCSGDLSFSVASNASRFHWGYSHPAFGGMAHSRRRSSAGAPIFGLKDALSLVSLIAENSN